MYQIAKIVPALSLVLLLGACQARPTAVVSLIDRPALTVPPVDNIKMRSVNWYVISKNAAPGKPGSVDNAFKKSNGSSLFAVSAKDYENIAINTANFIKTIKQHQAQVNAYRDYYVGTEAKNPQGRKNVGKEKPAAR
jgi:hypothetical protein